MPRSLATDGAFTKFTVCIHDVSKETLKARYGHRGYVKVGDLAGVLDAYLFYAAG